MMIPAVLEKAAWFGTALVLLLQGRLNTIIFGFASSDMVLGVLFAIAFVKTPKEQH
jgi:hypothetical protein